MRGKDCQPHVTAFDGLRPLVVVVSDLRQSHFNVGTAKVDWVSMAKTDFSAPINPKTADLPIETMNDLRNPHYKLGFEKMSYTTTSRSEHSRSNSVAH